MRRIAPALVVVLAAMFAVAHAQDFNPLVGQRVVVKYKRPLMIGGVAVEPKDYRAYTVEQADGDYLWLASGGIAGWVPKDEVVTLDEAIAFYTDELRINPLAWNAFLYRGFVWDLKHDYDKAIADYSEAIRIYPLWANSFNNRGWSWHKKKAYDRAIADYNEAIRLEPTCVRAIVNRGFARQDKGEYYKALADYDRALKVDPKYSPAYVARAWLFATCPDRKFRDGKLAVASATRACQLSQWKEAPKLAVLAAAYAEAGDFDKAVRWQQEANDRFFEPEDRKEGQERIALYRRKKPYRPRGVAESDGRRSEPTEIPDPFAGFPDPALAGRIYSELEEKIGPIDAGDDVRAREASQKKIAAAILQASRKHHIRQREVRAIWNAGHESAGSH